MDAEGMAKVKAMQDGYYFYSSLPENFLGHEETIVQRKPGTAQFYGHTSDEWHQYVMARMLVDINFNWELNPEYGAPTRQVGKINAIRYFRSLTQVSLRDAKAWADQYEWKL